MITSLQQRRNAATIVKDVPLSTTAARIVVLLSVCCGTWFGATVVDAFTIRTQPLQVPHHQQIQQQQQYITSTLPSRHYFNTPSPQQNYFPLRQQTSLYGSKPQRLSENIDGVVYVNDRVRHTLHCFVITAISETTPL
jgi:hypothetical protein